MSVQAGIWNFDGKQVNRKLLGDLSEFLKQQGPDGESCYVEGSVALLYRPFHTTAESRIEKQPYHSRLGFVFTWDGRLDNREELIHELRNDLVDDHTDVAIFAAAFERRDIDCFRQLVGDWAVSIWNPRERELIFACDYMAIRHIFYYLKKDRIWWSTDLAPLVLLSGDKLQIDDDYIAGFLANDPDAHLTPYREIRQVPAGQFVRVRDWKIQVERFWCFSPKCRIRYKTDLEYEEHFRHVFRHSVRRRLRSDSPILAELSGGLDSSSIVCMADDILTNERVQTPQLDTVSYYDKNEPRGDDWIYFHKIEEKRGRAGTHIDASEVGSSPSSLGYRDFMALPGHLGITHKLLEERTETLQKGGYRAVLSGIGGDEFMGGIPNPAPQLADLILQFQLVRLAQQLIAWSLAKRRPWIQLLGQALIEFLPSPLAVHFVKYARVEPWIEREFAKRTRIAIRKLDVEDHFGFLMPTRRSYIGGVVLMANKLAKQISPKDIPEETRYPYLDQSLIEFVLSIPATQLLRPGERRSLMRRSLVGIVPPEILSRRTKQFGARTPLVALEKNLHELHKAFDSPLSSKLGYTNRAYFLDAVQAARKGKEVHILRMLKTTSLEFWLKDLASRHLIETEAAPFPPLTAVSREAHA